MRISRMVLHLLSLCACVIISHAAAQAKKAEPTPDFVVKAYAASVLPGLEPDQLENIQKTMNCGQGPFVALPPSASPKLANAETAYLLHVVMWSTVTGYYSPDRNTKRPSTWYVFRPQGNGKCSFVQTTFKANNQPLLYGVKTVWLIGVSYFREPIDQRNIALAYRVSSTPAIAQSVQDLGLLVSGILGAAPTAANLAYAAGGICPPPKEAPKPNHTLISVAKIYGTRWLPFNLNVTLSLSMLQPGGLPDGRVGIPYNANISATGGSGTYLYTVVSGQLPRGLGVDPSSGLLSGTSTTPGQYSFKVQVKDTSDPAIVSSIDVTLKIVPAATVLFAPGAAPLVSGSLPGGAAGVPYSSGVAAMGGNGNYSFSYTGNLPPGLTMNSATGAITGTPQVAALPQTFRFTVHISDAANSNPGAPPANQYDLATQIQIGTPTPAVTDLNQLPGLTIPRKGIPEIPNQTIACNLPIAKLGHPYSIFISWEGGPATWGFKSSAVQPPGLDVHNNGAITGIPLATGVFPFELVMMSPVPADQNTVKAPLQLKIESDATIDFRQNSSQFGPLPSSTVNEPYTAGISTINAPSPVTYTIDTSQSGLGDQITIDPNTGIISGTPSVAGEFEVTVFATLTTNPGETKRFVGHVSIGEPLVTVTLGISATPGSSLGMQAGGIQPGGAGRTGAPSNLGMSQPAGSPSSASQPPSAALGKQAPGGPGAQTPGAPSANTQPSANLFDCSSLSSTTPCTYSTSFLVDERQPIGFSLGVSIPGVREKVYSSPTTSSIVTHTDVYGLIDFYPAFHWKNQETPIPHFNVGMPVTSQPFHRPYFGVSENLTSWWLERRGFPVRINLMGGMVYMKQQDAVPGPNSTTILVSNRVWKPLVGVEIPLSALASKITSAVKSPTPSPAAH